MRALAAGDDPIELYWLPTAAIAGPGDVEGFDGIWIVPGSPYANPDGVLAAIEAARTRRIPLLGTCGGFQHLLLEFARNVCGLAGVEHAELHPDASALLLVPLRCKLFGEEATVTIEPGTTAGAAMGAGPTTERYFCRYGLNAEYRSVLEDHGLVISGRDDLGDARVVELPGHPFFVGSLFQPELASDATWAHPLIAAFAAAVRVHAARRRPPGRGPWLMAALSDTKDWTWVLERACPACGLDTRTIGGPAVPGLLATTGSAWQRVLTSRPDAGIRPAEDRWSVLEYGCHVRDVFALADRRFHLMLSEDDPVFANWDQDATAVSERYGSQDPGTVAVELLEAAATLGRVLLAGVPTAGWSRPGRRSDGARFTVESFARYVIHDPVHHLHDVGATMPGPTRPGGPGFRWPSSGGGAQAAPGRRQMPFGQMTIATSRMKNGLML